MYSRSYFTEESDKVNVPKNYDGTAFIEQQNAENSDTPPYVRSEEATSVSNFEDNSPHFEEEERGINGGEGESREAGLFSTLFKSFPLGGVFSKGGLFSGLSGLKFPTIGTEEIIIIAAAAYLFFSKDGDRECAILLLLLLLIN